MSRKFEEHPGTEFDRRFYSASHATFTGLGRVIFGLRVEGAEHIPESGRVLVGFNHIDGLDTILAAIAMNRRHVTIYGRRKYMEMPVVGWAFRHWGAETIDRPGEGEAMHRDMLDVIKLPLTRDRASLMFVPGTRTPGMKPGWPKRGIAKFSEETKSPVIAGVLRGSDNLLKRRLTVKYSDSMDPARNRRDHERFMYDFMRVQRSLFDSIDDGLEYKDPLEPIINEYLGGELPDSHIDFVRAYRQYNKDNKILEEA